MGICLRSVDLLGMTIRPNLHELSGRPFLDVSLVWSLTFATVAPAINRRSMMAMARLQAPINHGTENITLRAVYSIWRRKWFSAEAQPTRAYQIVTSITRMTAYRSARNGYWASNCS